MRVMRMLAGLLAVGMVAGSAAAQVKEQAEPKPKPTPERRPRAVFGGPFMRLTGLSTEQREKLAALWTETNKKIADANAGQLNALKTYHEEGEKVLNDAQRKELADMRAEREARMKAARERKPAERPAEKPEVRPALRGMPGPLAGLKDLTDDQIKRINELSAVRAEASKAAVDAMREKLAAADKAFDDGLEGVLTSRQKAALKAAAARAEAERQTAAKKAADERRKRTFGGDFRRLRGLADEQELALGQLWHEAQATTAAARKAEEAARAEYLAKGKRLLNPEQLKALEELTRPKAEPEGTKKPT